MEDAAAGFVETFARAGEDAAKAAGAGLGSIAAHSKSAQDALRGVHDAQSTAALSAERLAVAQMRYTAAAVNTASSATQLASAHLAVSSAQQSHERAAQALTEAQTRLNATHQGAVGYLAAHSASLGEWTMAAGAAAGAALGLVSALAHVGETFENINRGLELTNSSTGAAMEEMRSHADALVGTVDTATNQIGSDMGVLASRLSLEPGAALDSLTHNVGMLRDRFGQLNTPALTAGFREFHVEASQTNDAMASLTQTAIGVGANVGTVVTQLAAGGTTLAEAGLNYQQAAYLISQADKDIGEGGAQKAITGIEMGMKDAAKHGKDFQTYIKDIMYSLGVFQQNNETQKFDTLAEQAFGTRKWAEVQAIFKDYNESLHATNQQLQASPGYLGELENKTRNLDNVFHQLRNHIEAALAPPGENAVDFVGDKVKELMSWVDAHRDDLRQLFVTGLDAAEKLLQMITDIAGWLARYPGAIEAAIVVFGTWKSIEGVAALITSLTTIDTLLKGMPASAALAGSGIATGLAPAIVALTTLAALWNLHGDSAPTNVGPGADDRQKRLEAGKAYADTHGGQVPPGYAQWLDKGGAAPPGITLPGGAPGTPYFDAQGRPLNADGSLVNPGGGAPNPTPYVPGSKSVAPSATGGPASGWAGGPGPGGDLIEPDGPKGKKGPRLPTAPEVPYGAGYGAPPEIGETERHYAARQHLLEEQHKLAEDQARLDQLEKDSNATQDDIQKVKNKILTDRGNILKAEGELYQREEGTLKRRGDAMEELGAKIDQDFGISKGLPGIAENLTKFLANLAFAPVFGALEATKASMGGPTYGGKGIAGMIGLAAGMGGPGAAAEGGGETGWTGTGWGGPAAPGLGGKLPSIGGGGGRAGGGRGGGGGGWMSAILNNLGRTAESGLPGIGGVPDGGGVQDAGGVGGVNLSTIPVAVQKYANDCIDASARIILSHSGTNMSEDQLKGVIAPGGSIDSQAAGMNMLDPAGQFRAMGGSGGSQAAMYAAIKASIDNGTGSILNVAPGSSIAGRNFSEGHFIAVTGYNPDGTINLSDSAGGTKYTVSAADAFQATRGRGIVAGTGTGPQPGGGPRAPQPGGPPPPGGGLPILGSPSPFDRNPGNPFSLPRYAEGGSIGGPGSGGIGDPKLPDWWRKVLSSSIGGEGPPIPINNAWMPNAGGQPLPPWMTPSGGHGPMMGYAEGGATPPPVLPSGAVPIIAHENEHVLTSSDVNALGGQAGVYAMRDQLHAGEGQPGGGPSAPRAGAPVPAMQAHPGGPAPGPSLIGGMAPSAGFGSGFQVTGSGLVGLAESLPATAAQMAISGASAAAAALYGGAIADLPRYEDGGGVPPGGGGGAPGSPGGGGGPAGGAPGGSLVSAAINIGMQELNEGISKGAQAVGAGVGGLMQTFGPGQFAQSKQAQTGWISKLVGGIAGAHPQLPNMAGGHGASPGLSPEQAASQHMAAGGVGGEAPGPGAASEAGGPLVHIENLNNYGNENSMGKAVGDHVQASYNINSFGSR